MAEAGRPSRRAGRLALKLAAAPGLLAKGIGYRAALAAAGASMLEGWVLAEVKGGAGLDGEAGHATLARLREDGTPSPDDRRAFEVDAVVMGYGLTPIRGVRARRRLRAAFPGSRRGGWLPTRSGDLETSVAGLFVAGDAAGIGGAEIALAEGELAGMIVAGRLGGRVSSSRVAALRRRLARLERFRQGLEALYAVPPLRLAREDTVVCRCEDVTRADLLAAAHGGGGPGAMKAATRASMGRCQGRNCLGPMAAIAAEVSGTGEEDQPWPRARAPVRPVPLAALLDEPLAPPRSPDLVEAEVDRS